jgi:hypothetical protein
MVKGGRIMIYLLTSLVIFWLYQAYTFGSIGVKKSISDTFFDIKHPILFRLFIWGISVPLIIYSTNYSTGLFIAGLLIMAVGFAAGFKGDGHKVESRNHVIGATGGILAAYSGFGIEFVCWKSFYMDLYFWAIVAFIVPTIIMMVRQTKNHTTWIEVIAYNIVILTLIIEEL